MVYVLAFLGITVANRQCSKFHGIVAIDCTSQSLYAIGLTNTLATFPHPMNKLCCDDE